MYRQRQAIGPDESPQTTYNTWKPSTGCLIPSKLNLSSQDLRINCSIAQYLDRCWWGFSTNLRCTRLRNKIRPDLSAARLSLRLAWELLILLLLSPSRSSSPDLSLASSSSSGLRSMLTSSLILLATGELSLFLSSLLPLDSRLGALLSSLLLSLLSSLLLSLLSSLLLSRLLMGEYRLSLLGLLRRGGDLLIGERRLGGVLRLTTGERLLLGDLLLLRLRFRTGDDRLFLQKQYLLKPQTVMSTSGWFHDSCL